MALPAPESVVFPHAAREIRELIRKCGSFRDIGRATLGHRRLILRASFATIRRLECRGSGKGSKL
jgi:hypothetical protein